jgi:hypothetical protein
VVATLLLEDLNKANDNELADHLNGLLAAPGGGFDPSNIIPRQIPVEPTPVAETELPAPPPQELQDHVQSLFAPSLSTPAPTPVATSSPAAPTPQPNVVQQLADHVAQTTGLKWIGEGITNLQGGVQQATSGLTNLVVAKPQVSPAPMSAGGSSGPAPGGPLVEYARQAAQRFGVDPDIFVRQIQQESGFRPDARSPAGATGIAQFMPDTARGMGVDPSDPYQSLEGGARLMRQNLDRYGGDYAKALAAYNAGPGNVDKYGGVPPFEETQRYISTILGGTSGRAAATPTEGLGRAGAAIGAAQRDISQFGDSQLTNSQAYAACGPAAAVRFAQRFGRNPTLSEAVNLARTVGWTEEQGMAGLASEKALMDKMGVATKMVSGADWGTFANEARTGNPVTISTRGHYFTADGWDPATNRFHVGRSGLDLKGGSEWMTPEQMTGLMGEVQGGLLADNPQAPGSTVQVAGVQSAPQAAPEGRQGIQFLGDDSQTAAGFTAPGGAPRGFLEQAAGTVGEGFSWLGEAAQGGLQVLDDAVNATGTANPTPASVPGGGYDPSALRAETTSPQEGVPLRQDARDLGQQAQPTLLEPGGPVGELLGQIGAAPGFSEADRAARRQAIEESPVGQAYGSDIRKQLLPNITESEHPANVLNELIDKYGGVGRSDVPLEERMTPEDRERYRNAQLTIGGMTGMPSAGAAGRAGRAARAIDYEGLAALRRAQRVGQDVLEGTPSVVDSRLNKEIAATVSNVFSVPSLAQNAISGGIETIKRPVLTALSGDLGAAGADVRAMGLAVGDGLADLASTFRTGIRPSRAPTPDVAGQEAFLGKDIFKDPEAWRVAFLRGMGASDEFLRHINAAGGMGSRMVQLAREFPELTQAEIRSRFGNELLKAGELAADESVFATGGTGLGRKMAGWRAKLTDPTSTWQEKVLGGLTQILVPFSNVPDVILSRGVLRTPGINELTTGVKVAQAIKAGDATRVRREIVSGAMAETVNVAILAQVLEGNITGNGPSDPDKKRALEQARDADGNPVWQANSVRVPTPWGTRFVPYSSFGDVAIRAGAIANAVEQIQEESSKPNPSEDASQRILSTAGNLLQGEGETIGDAWYLQQVGRMFNAMKYGGLPALAGGEVLSTAMRFVPGAGQLRSIEQVLSPEVSEPRNPIEAVAAQLPGATELVRTVTGNQEFNRPKLDPATGQPLVRQRDWSSLVSKNVGPGQQDLVNETLARHNLGVSEAPDTVTLPAVGKLPAIAIGITEDEKRTYEQIAGKYIADDIQAAIAQPSFQQMSQEDRRKELQAIIADARKDAAKEIYTTLSDAEFNRRVDEAERAQKAGAEPVVRLPR